MTMSDGAVVPGRARPLQSGRSVSPAPERAQQRVPGCRLDRFAGQAYDESDQRPHLLQILTAARTRSEVRLKAAGVRFRKRALQIFGDALDQLLASHLLESVIVLVHQPISIGVRSHVTHPPRNRSRELNAAGSVRGAAERAGSPRSARALRTLRGPAIRAHLEESPRHAANVAGSANRDARPPWSRAGRQLVQPPLTTGEEGSTSDPESWDGRGAETVRG